MNFSLIREDMIDAQMQDSIVGAPLALLPTPVARKLFRVFRSAEWVAFFVAFFFLVATVVRLWHYLWWVPIVLAIWAFSHLLRWMNPDVSPAGADIQMRAFCHKNNIEEAHWDRFHMWCLTWDAYYDPARRLETEQPMPYLYWERDTDQDWREELWRGRDVYLTTYRYMQRNPKGFLTFVGNF